MPGANQIIGSLRMGRRGERRTRRRAAAPLDPETAQLGNGSGQFS